MNRKRANLKILDIDKDVKEKKKEEVYIEFTETFQMNHDNKVGQRNKRVTLEELFRLL